MCKSKMATKASEPTSTRTPRTRTSQSSRTSTRSTPPPTITTRTPTTSTTGTSTSTSNPSTSTSNYSNTKPSTASTSISSRTSLSSLRDSLPEKTHIYDISEIRSATNNFLAKRFSSSSSTASWRCTLRGRNTVIFQRKFRRKIIMDQLKERLSVICRSHHMSIVSLLGASISGDYIYLVYDFIDGANLADCLRNPKNPNFTVLSTWISRMQIATDLAHGLDYIHNNTGLNMSLVHNHIKSSSVVVTEPSFNVKICHFGTAQLCGEIDENKHDKSETTEIEEVEEHDTPAMLTRSDSGIMQFEGVRGYMAPEFQASGIATQKTDVYAFGVVILELLSGEEPLKYKFNKRRGDFVRTSVIDTAREAIDGGGDDDADDGSGGSGGGGGGSREGRLRKWVDRRLRDSFPVEVVEKLTRVALECVHVDPDQRPNMARVAGKISKLYLDSRIWSDKVRIPTGISVSLAPR